MSDFFVNSEYSPSGDQPVAIEQLSNGIMNGDKHQVLLGITGSGKTFTMANVIEKVQKPTLIISHNKTLAAQLYGEFKQLFPNNAVEYFISYYDYYQPEAYLPVTDTFIEKDMSINEEIDILRLKATSSLLSRKDVIVVSSVSCIYGIGSPDEYRDKVIHLKKGMNIDRKKLFKELVNIHYSRNDSSFERSNFRVRGDVVDIFLAYEDVGVRLEFFGSELEKIYRFYPLTGEILSEHGHEIIYPGKHFVTDQNTINRVVKEISTDLVARLDELKKNDKLLEAQRLEQRTNFDLEMMMEVGYCSGIENYSRYFDGRKPGEAPYTLIDFFPKDFLMVVDESHIAIPQIRGQYEGDKSRKSTLVDYGFRLPAALDNRPLKFDEWKNKVNSTVLVSATPGKWENENSEIFIEQIIRPTGLLDPNIFVRPTKNQIEDLLSEIKSVIDNGNRVLVTTLTKKMSEALSDYFLKMGIKTRYLHSDIDTLERIEILRDLRKGEFDVLVGINLLREGLDLPEVQLVAIMDADKEGFLRSETSLIQTVGRAARNKDGYVIMYADKVTDSITKSVNETKRRREIQKQHNEKYNINPTTVKKEITDILEIVERNRPSKEDISFRSNINLKNASREDLYKISKDIEKEMKVAADLLEFEVAARLRDELKEIKKEIMELPS